jgi:hypothetical protein
MKSTPLAPDLRFGPTGKRKTQANREVYFVQAETLGLIKIGVANQASRRFVSLQADSPDPLRLLGIMTCENHGALEFTLHLRFAHLRVRGEWFRPDPELLAFIEENVIDEDERQWRYMCETVAAIAREKPRTTPNAKPLPA